MELIKENIEFEKLHGENTSNNLLKEEYIIPDSHPDIKEVVVVDAKPIITSKEVTTDKVYVEGQLISNVIYLADIDDVSEVFNVVYHTKFSFYVDVKGTDHKMEAMAQCFIEHIECKIINERKISIEGVLKVKAEVYSNESYDIVKEITGLKNTQMLNYPLSIDKLVGKADVDMVANAAFHVSMDKPQIGSVTKCDICFHKKTTKVEDDKLIFEGFANVFVLYKSKDSKELIPMEEDIMISGEAILLGIDENSDVFSDFTLGDVNFNVKEDDLGESRIIEVQGVIKAEGKVYTKTDIDIIEDAYSPDSNINLIKKDRDLTVIFGYGNTETIVKENIELESNAEPPTNVLMTTGKVTITDKKVIEDKVVIEGIIKVAAIYSTNNPRQYIAAIEDEIPFSISVEVMGCKAFMDANVKLNIDTLEGNIEANTVAIKALISANACIKYSTHKEFIEDVMFLEGDSQNKKASVTIYVVQNGDTLWKIAKKYNTTLEKLVRINNINDGEHLMPGDKIIIEGRAII